MNENKETTVTLLNKMFDTRGKKAIGTLFAIIVVISIIIDNLVIGGEYFFEELIRVVGAGGGAIYFGALLLAVETDDPNIILQKNIVALIGIVGGVLSSGLFLMSWCSIMLVR